MTREAPSVFAGMAVSLAEAIEHKHRHSSPRPVLALVWIAEPLDQMPPDLVASMPDDTKGALVVHEVPVEPSTWELAGDPHNVIYAIASLVRESYGSLITRRPPTAIGEPIAVMFANVGPIVACICDDEDCDHQQWIRAGNDPADHPAAIEMRTVTLMTTNRHTVIVGSDEGGATLLRDVDGPPGAIAGPTPDALTDLVTALVRKPQYN